jgi:NADH dehydrogenase [ubiquinone] 1 alpha subcomplex assembly factor 3
MVNSYSANGFRLNNGMKVYGPIAVFPTCVLAWKVPGPLEITAESLSLFALIHPRPEVVFVGYGQRGAKFNEKAAMALTSSPCNFQFMATEDAISAYNYLSVEGRLVGAALIPPDTVKRLRESDYEDTTAKQRDTKFWDMEGGGDPFGDDYTGGDGTKNKKGW